MKYLDKIKTPDDLKKIDQTELNEVASELRKVIIETTSKNGGHLAASLGAVELAIALHYVLNCPEDKLIWDVGHQAYAHKLLTGRFDSFHTLRKFKGISGFPNMFESEYDAITVGHSSTSIAAAMGYAKARDLNGKNNRVIAVIGDGALTSGLALEALNNAASINSRMTVVLNDNEMSISPNVGAMSEYLNKLITNPKYNKIKDEIENILYKLPKIGGVTKFISKKIQESLKNLVIPKIIFEEFGFRYFGPIDGHDINEIIKILQSVVYYSGPKIVHIKTVKGKGYLYAENNPSFYHGLGPFDITTGKLADTGNKISFTKAFGETLAKLAEKNNDIVAVTAAMPDGTGLNKFKEKFPNRFFDVGIAEDFAVTFGAGLAAEGKKPFIAIYSTFLQRSIDQIYHDAALQKKIAPVFAIDRAGLVGSDGATHHGVLDLTYTLMIPNLTVMIPSDEYDLVGMMKIASELKTPCSIRYPRGNIIGTEIPDPETVNLKFGDNQILLNEGKILIAAVGPAVHRLKKIIDSEKIPAALVNCRFIKPFNAEFFITLFSKYEKIITVEENSVIGGFGAFINIFINENKLYDKKVMNIGIPDRFIESGEIDELYGTFGFDDESLKNKIIEFIK
ncbi:MAG TPA: 1-deoxy-D-xylulose-5-phosphate synthase [bacterium]|nr:1-deoxy-D-xylulose-5-phosphate synthase [bacterium]HPN29923.1 1-deoxy-D-xylulose-5-phosphate synthase [bacterium]